MLYRINLKPILIGLGLALAIPMGAPANSAPESSTNGIYGGYLGSSAWFTEMRRSVTRSASGHQQWRDAIERGLKDGTLAEICWKFDFPMGIHFLKVSHLIFELSGRRVISVHIPFDTKSQINRRFTT
jgi:hypothetical protein